MNTNIDAEVWKDVKGYEGHYRVSNFGRIKSVERIVKYGDRHHTVKERFKKPTMKKTPNTSNGEYTEKGYMCVSLYKDNKSQMKYVHRLVAEAFIRNPENKETINHIDGDKQNNHVSNLEWATHEENNTHAIETGLSTYEHLKPELNTSSMVVMQFDGNKLIAEFPSMRAAERANGLSNGVISKAIKKGWLSGGYTWKIKK